MSQKEVKKVIEYRFSPYFGCDPELFITTGSGEVVGAEKVLPEDGNLNVSKSSLYGGGNNIVLDGVQIELNPPPDPCRANLSNSIQAAMIKLREHLKTQWEMKVSFASVVSVDQKELDSLSEKAKVFGCMPSENVYDKGATVTANPTTYLKRSAGGHIHLGLSRVPAMMERREDLVKLMDILVGNTCVLIDRDPEAAERRKNYGRAGEHRLPTHGLEYRTLSNFWMRSYPLMSFVMGMSRFACNVLDEEMAESLNAQKRDAYLKQYPGWPAFSELLEKVNLQEVKEAINENDLQLALKNWEVVKGFISDHATAMYSLWKDTLPQFDFFCQRIWEGGLEYWFPQDPMTHWCEKSEGHTGGWESFLGYTVQQKMNAYEKGLVI